MSIYVLRSDNLVKIGFSDDLRTRVNAIIAAVPVPVEFVGHMPGSREVERHLHERFKAHRFSGEWFVESADMRVAFEAILTPNMPALAPVKSVRRSADDATVQEASDAIRKAAELRWPALAKGKRVKAIAQDLGWSEARVKTLYYADPRMALRTFEKEELASWLEGTA